MKKFATVALSAVLAATGLAGLTACSDRTYTIGLICLHGDSSTYDKNFIDAMREACENLGVSDQLTIVTDIPEGNVKPPAQANSRSSPNGTPQMGRDR